MQKAQYHKLTAQEAKQRLDKENDIILLDVRTEEEFNESHIPSSINIPVSLVFDKVKELYDKETKIFIYCRSGVRSRVAASQLALMGYNKVYDFGGILSWPFEKV